MSKYVGASDRVCKKGVQIVFCNKVLKAKSHNGPVATDWVLAISKVRAGLKVLL